MRKLIKNEYGEVIIDRTEVKRLGGKIEGNIFCSPGAGYISKENWETKFLPLILALPELVNSAYAAATCNLTGRDEYGDEVTVSPGSVDVLQDLYRALEPYELLI